MTPISTIIPSLILSTFKERDKTKPLDFPYCKFKHFQGFHALVRTLLIVATGDARLILITSKTTRNNKPYFTLLQHVYNEQHLLLQLKYAFRGLTKLALYTLGVAFIAGRHRDLVYVDGTGIGTSPQGRGVALTCNKCNRCIIKFCICD